MVLCAGYFSRGQTPNVLLTTSYRPSKVMFHFLADMLDVLPCAQFYKRQVMSTQSSDPSIFASHQ